MKASTSGLLEPPAEAVRGSLAVTAPPLLYASIFFAFTLWEGAHRHGRRAESKSGGMKRITTLERAAKSLQRCLHTRDLPPIPPAQASKICALAIQADRPIRYIKTAVRRWSIQCWRAQRRAAARAGREQEAEVLIAEVREANQLLHLAEKAIEDAWLDFDWGIREAAVRRAVQRYARAMSYAQIAAEDQVSEDTASRSARRGMTYLAEREPEAVARLLTARRNLHTGSLRSEPGDFLCTGPGKAGLPKRRAAPNLKRLRATLTDGNQV